MKVLKLATLACLALPALAQADYVIQDGKNVMKIGGQLRTSFNTGVEQNRATGFKDQKFNEVTVDTANIHFAGAINENLVYKLRLKMAPQSTSDENVSPTGAKTHSFYNMVDYAFAGYAFRPELTVGMGKVPVGIGFDNQFSAMSPLSFSQDVDFFFGSGTANGIMAFGTFMEAFDYNVTAVNHYDVDNMKYEKTNDNRSMDYTVSLAHHTKDAADAEGYNAGGAYKHYVAVDFAQVENGNATKRNVYAASGFFSYENAIVHAGVTTENTKGRKDDFWTLGAGYLYNKTWRPAMTYSSIRSESLLGVKGTHHVIAANLTQFHDDNKWRSFAEFATTGKSDEAKTQVKAAGADDKTPWKLSVGFSVNI